MDVKKIALLVGALVIAVVTAVMAKNMFAGAGATQAQAAPAVPLGPKVLVARKALPVGTIIDAESLTYQPWPKELVQSAYYTEGAPDGDMSKLLGTVVRNPVTAGQPRHRGALVGPNDRGFLAAALGPGHARRHGARVTHQRRRRLRLPGRPRRHGPDPGGRPAAATARRSRSPRRSCATCACSPPTSASTARTRKARPRSRPSPTVTLEVTPRIAEKIAVAQCMGTLRCRCARSPTTRPSSSGPSPRARSRCPAGTNPAEERRMLLAVANRPIDTNTTFTTGGDVSRFQRRTRPGHGAVRPRSQRVAGVRHAPVRPAASAAARRPAGPVSASRAAILSPSFRWEHVKMTSHQHPPPRPPRHRARRPGHRPRQRHRRRPAAAQPRQSARPSETLNLSQGTGTLVAAVRADDRRVRRQRRDRRRPGSLVDPALCLRQGSGETTIYRHRQERPGRLCRQRPRRQQHRLGRRDAAPGDARRRASRSTADEQPGAAHRHRRLARRCRGSASARSSRPMSATGTQVSAACARRRRCRSRSRSRSPRSTAPCSRRSASTCSAATRPAASSSASARAAGDRHRRRPTSAVPACNRRSAVGDRRSARPASCSASTCSARSTSPKPTAW